MALPTCTMVDCFLKPPALDAFTCAPQPSDGEVTEILLTAEAMTNAEITTALTLAARIDNAAVAADAIVRLKVTGKVIAPDIQFTRVEGGQQVQQARKNYSIEAEFFNDSDVNYEAVRKLQHCGKPMFVYYVMGGKIYGGSAAAEDGINTFVNLTASSEGFGSYLKYVMKIGWESTLPPARLAYVLA